MRQDLDNLPVLGKEDSKILKKAKTTKMVKKEKGSKGSVSSDNNKMMPPPVISTAKAPKSSRAPSGRRAPISLTTLRGKEAQA